MNVNKIRHVGKLGRQKMAGSRNGGRPFGQKMRTSLAKIHKKSPK